jgi:aryl-alcohol dehydrogenase-like predicted oxidoreductase
VQLRRLGELRVSAVSLGCFSYGEVEEQETLSLIDRALELGINMLDTSDTYGVGQSERLVGMAVRGRRDRVVVASKFGQIKLPGDPKPRGVCGRPDYARQACDASLARLGVDCIDLYYLHRVDPQVPVEDTVGAMADLVHAGKVRHLGLSEVGTDIIRRACAVHPITAVQNELSLVTRESEELIPLLEQKNIGFVAYSPLGRGMLTGGLALAENDIRRQFPRFTGAHLADNISLVDRLGRIAAKRAVTPGQLALAWVLARGDDVVAIPGTRRRDRLEENVAAAGLTLGKEELAELEQLFPPGAASGARR